jgi:hypothetical protein
MKDSNIMENHVPKSLYWYTPLTIMIGLILCFIFIEQGPFYEWLLRSEYGVIENLTILYSFIGAIISFKLIGMSKNLPYTKFFKVWFTLFTIALIYLGGEEASWGQHIFGWESSEYFLENNQMYETNLHNLTPQMEQVPKILLHLAAIFGGLIWPLLIYLKKIKLTPDSLYDWVMPNKTVVMSCFLAIAVRLWERYYAWMQIKPEYAERDAFKELKEANETFLVLFILIYLISIFYRIKAQKKA